MYWSFFFVLFFVITNRDANRFQTNNASYAAAMEIRKVCPYEKLKIVKRNALF